MALALPLRKILKSVASIDGLHSVLTHKYGLTTLSSELSGKRILHVSRPSGIIGAGMCDIVQESCTLLVIDENMKVVAKAPDKVYPLEDPFCEIKHVNEYNPAYVTDWIDGTLVVISKRGSSYLISTKNSVHGADLLGTSELSVSSVVLDLLDIANPYKGIDLLFDAKEVPSLNELSWSFVIRPKNGVYTNDFRDYEMYLVGAFNTETEYTASMTQLASLARQLCLKMPERQKIFNFKQATVFMNSRAKKMVPYKGIIFTDCADGSTASARYINKSKIQVEKEKKIDVDGALLNKLIPYVTPFLEDKPSIVFEMCAKDRELTYVVYKHFNEYIDSVRKAFAKAEHSRSKKAFAERVKGHEFATVLYALYSGKIETPGRAIDVLSPKRFATHILLKDADNIAKLVKEKESDNAGKG